MLFILLIVTLFFLILNLYITERDILHPSVVFNLFFVLSEIVCIIFQNMYHIQLHYQTVLVLGLGSFVFTFVAAFSKRYEVKSKYTIVEKLDVSYIRINRFWEIGLIFIQLISIVSFIQYLRMLSVRVYGSVLSLNEMIALYDQVSKFFSSSVSDVSVPILYRLTNPIAMAAGHLVFYVAINNFVAAKKISKYQVVIILLLLVIFALNGSRTPIFRLITMALAVFYIVYFRHKRRQVSLKFLIRLALFAVLTIIGLVLLLFITGRMSSGSDLQISSFLFVYLGAPIVNLDNWLVNPIINTNIHVFGAYTFAPIYSYLRRKFNIPIPRYNVVLRFQSTEDGLFLGNVYTMYYKIFYDFGYAGVLILTGVMAVVYCLLYDRIFYKSFKTKKLSMKLFLYSYIFNDLLMSFFSTRFYETLCAPSFWTMMLIAYVMKLVVIDNKVKITPTLKLKGIKIRY